MRLKYCSFTGADDRTDPEQLSDIAKRYPFTEWAILCWPGHAGIPRFPTITWIKEFKQKVAGQKALHLCREAVNLFIDGDPSLLDLMKGFSRIQLNFDFGGPNSYDLQRLAGRVKQSPEWQFIIQHGKKCDILPLLSGNQSHAVLFDQSAGTGKDGRDNWPSPIAGRFCGYAGGIRPEKYEDQLRVVSGLVPDNYETWTDVETGVQSNDGFDLTRCSRMIEIAVQYVNPPQLRRDPLFPLSRL